MRRIPLAWCNVIHYRARSATALCGVIFAVVLIYMQLGFYDCCYRSSTLIYDQLRFDVALISPSYAHFRSAGAIPKSRLHQARQVAGVESVAPLYVANSTYRTSDSRVRREITVLGIDAANSPFQIDKVAADCMNLARPDTAIMDVKVSRGYGSVHQSMITELEHRRIEIVSTYSHGTGFVCDASIVVSDRTLARMFNGYPLDQVSIGLVALSRGIDAKVATRELRSSLPADVQVLARSELEAREQNYFVRIKPLGIMFSAGVLLSFVVGAVALYQILSAEVMNRLREFATLLVLGFTVRTMRWTVVQQALTLAAFRFVPPTVLPTSRYAITRASTHLPMFMTLPRIGLVLMLTLLMCSLAGALVSVKVSR